MSVKVMSMVWEAEGLSPTHRLVLLSLADHANDEGICYPSIARLCRRTGLKERAAQGAIKALQDMGWLRVERNAGPRGCNLFTVNPPAADAPPQQMHPRTKRHPPPQQMRPTPAADAPEPSRTVIEPSAAAAREPQLPKPDHLTTDRERYLAACGVTDVVSGLTGHGSARLGTAADMEVARKWTAAPPDGLGLTVDDCVQVIREVVTRGATPRRFAYFDGAMSELAAARHRPVPKHKPRAFAANTEPSQADRMSRWERLAKG